MRLQDASSDFRRFQAISECCKSAQYVQTCAEFLNLTIFAVFVSQCIVDMQTDVNRYAKRVAYCMLLN